MLDQTKHNVELKTHAFSTVATWSAVLSALMLSKVVEDDAICLVRPKIVVQHKHIAKVIYDLIDEKRLRLRPA